MYILITYDVETKTPAGVRRLRHVAKTCENYGQRVQASVFECMADHATWVLFRSKLLDIIDDNTDSLRFYFLNKNWDKKIEHHGKNDTYDISGPLII